ncbi:MAG: alpha-glucosidase [Limnohabitans sp.]
MAGKTPWWQRSTIYQIYPRSFCDSNGDGIGDLPGIVQRLDHVQALGADVIWLSPVYASPNDDNGYDISDYCAIHPDFGTMEDFDHLVHEMKRRGLSLIMDLVVNHTSDEHEWFRQARSARDNPYHDYYIWREPVDGREPTNWESAFSGPAWTWNDATGEYYLHLFSPRQPDLNWDNPKVRAEVYRLMHFWLQKGVRGFRMDVINLISKPWLEGGALPDAPRVQAGFVQPAFSMVTHGPRFMEFMREMRSEVLDHYDTLTVGEAPCATVQQAREITHPDSGVLDMVFQFEHMDVDSQPGQGKWALRPLHLPELKTILSRWQNGLHGQGWNSLYWCNHDQPRVVSRFGDDSVRYRVRSACMLATALHLMQGTPFVYQGEELGMTNVRWPDIAHYRDIETLNMYRVAITERGQSPAKVLHSIHAKGRDNARTPMPWNAGPQAGFTCGTPWLAVHDNHAEVNAEQALDDPASVFHHYRRLIALRKTLPVLVHGRFELLLPRHPHLLAYLRDDGHTRLLVLCNFSGQFQPLEGLALPDRSGAQALIGNLPSEEWALAPHTLAAWEARVWQLSEATRV